MPLFVVLADRVGLDDSPRDRIRDAIRAGASPATSPTRSRRTGPPPHENRQVTQGPRQTPPPDAPAEQVLNPAAVDNPDLVAYFAGLGADRRRQRGGTSSVDDAARSNM
ncbi:hypothetical protein [Streptomyces sp. NPDC002088]|uniref:hypothetical protein n=1 Tax=Streptomyces sp. NPDC002088 TaxID=3154665 RepID=UPI0033266D0D